MAAPSVDIKNLDVITKKFGNLILGLTDTTSLMGEIGSYLIASILMRTSEGKDVEGIAFEPYSVSYEKTRENKGLPTDTVDLFFSGQMLSSLTYDATRDQVELFFANTPRKGSDASNPEIAYYNNEIREFFGISAEEHKEIVSMVEDYIVNIVFRKK